MQNTQAVSEMFRRIASRYDRMNRLMTFGLDLHWRRKAASFLRPLQPERLLDLAAGTGDFALAACQVLPSLKEVYLVDITPAMLARAPAKKPPQVVWHFQVADAHQLPFADSMMDAIVVGYGVRNFENRLQALMEMRRVLRPGGRAVILETGMPTQLLWKLPFWFYFRLYVPLLGALYARDKAAYTYLPESTRAFPHRDAFLQLALQAGFMRGSYVPLLGGASIIYLLDT
ncbi:MAG: ubiquinone/menaquinone biosynthesis methyltransferase [Bacteroidia bacterium]|nr:ubiquinone/menaquinone biosynthesis methyltransferase [Bacteroidia bacterium]MDW8234997.1 ubiquinone/menaquinone biosynthesis methyltransferase [Bacteroidia bacterium]